jgi:hypothetical protein
MDFRGKHFTIVQGIGPDSWKKHAPQDGGYDLPQDGRRVLRMREGLQRQVGATISGKQRNGGPFRY